MAKQEIQENEYNWDSGTYQTGATEPKKGQSAVITALLIAVIFLGGLASALGLMNIRLLSQMMNQQQNAVLPIAVDGAQGMIDDFLRENPNQAPARPSNPELELAFAEETAILTAQQIFQHNRLSVVTITVQTGQNQNRTGPAVVLSSDGFLLTNAHLTDNASLITVELDNGELLQAVLLAADAYSDVAVLYVGQQGMTPVVFAQEEITFAEDQHAYAFIQSDALSHGHILEGSRQFMAGKNCIGLMKTDFDGDHGPVFNERGELTGFLCRYFGEDGGSLMLSAPQLMNILQQLVEQGYVQEHPGVQMDVEQISNFCKEYWNLSAGLQVSRMLPGGTAENAGLLEGDILLNMDGVKLTTRQQFYDLLLSSQGKTVVLDVFRAGQHLTLQLSISKVS